MDACEAFCIAVKFYRSGEWNPALPARIKIRLDENDLTLRQICSLVEHITRPLPDSVVSDLFTSLRVRHSNLEKRLVTGRTYALGAGCLICLMDESEKAFRLSEARAGKPIRFQRLNAMESAECGPR
jgi:hypothetical protein